MPDAPRSGGMPPSRRRDPRSPPPIRRVEGKPSVFPVEVEASCRVVIEQAPVGIAQIKASTGRFVHVNSRFGEILGFLPDELLTRTWQEITHPDDACANEAGLTLMRSTGRPYRAETRYLRKDGSVLWASLTVSPVGKNTVVAIVEDITDRKKAEGAIRAGHLLEEQMERVGASVPGVICSLRLAADGRTSMPFATPFVEELSGISPKELARDFSPWMANIHPDDVARVGASLQNSARSLSGWHDVYRYLHPMKGERWFEARSMPLREPDGSVVFQGYFSDVTSSVSTGEALRTRGTLFRAIFNQAAVGMAQVEASTGRFLSTNDKLSDITGYPRDQLLDMRWQELTHPEDLELDLAARERVLAAGEHRTRQKRYVRRDGVPVWVQVTITPLSLGEDVPTTHILVVQDITARKRAELALQASEVKFRALIENSTDMIVVLDDAMRIVFWSQSATEQLGWTADEAIGRQGLEMLLSEDTEGTEPSFLGLLDRPGATIRRIGPQRCKDGSTRIVEVVAANLLHDPAVRGVVANLRDITEQRELEDKFQQAQKLESIGRLASGVAHDFNNLLTVILSYADSLNEDIGAGLRASADDVQEIRAAALRATSLTRQLLAFARKQVIAPVPVDIGAAVNESVKLVRRVLGEDIQLCVKGCADLWMAKCDPGQIDQVLMNLSVNARDAMPRGGRLTIETANALLSEKNAAAFPSGRGGEYVRLTVSDTGVGMSAEVKAHLFEPFFTTKEPGRGTGLGLATVYGIVEQSEGLINVRSELGQGTAFDLFFPRSLDRVAISPQPAPTVRGSEPVLVVEDNAQVREVCVRTLRDAGYDVYSAECPPAALELGPEKLGRIRLLLTDVVMPGFDGRALAEELSRRYPALRVLYMSGYEGDVLSQRGVLTSGIEFLPKPFTPADLLARVRAALDVRRGSA